MIEILKEDVNKYFKEIRGKADNGKKWMNLLRKENIKTKLKEMNKNVQDLKMKIKAKKETETKGILEIENLSKWTRTTEASITDRIIEMEEKISGIEDERGKRWYIYQRKS